MDDVSTSITAYVKELEWLRDENDTFYFKLEDLENRSHRFNLF